MFSSYSVYTCLKSDVIRLSHNHLHSALLADLWSFRDSCRLTGENGWVTGALELQCNVTFLEPGQAPTFAAPGCSSRTKALATRVYELHLLLEGLKGYRLSMALSQLHTKFTTNFFMQVEIVYAKSGSCCVRELD